MGLFLSDIHIRKNNNFKINVLIKELTSIMESKGYHTSLEGEEDFVSVNIYNPDGSQWVTVTSDCFEFGDEKDTKVLAVPLSDSFGTDVLAVACFDSDYLFMNLININDGTDAWVNVGSIPGMKMPRRTSFGAWKKKVRDIDSFKKIIKEKHMFAEEAFYCCENQFGFLKGQSLISVSSEEDVKESVIQLHFSLEEKEEKELPCLENLSYSLSPCIMGENSMVYAVNNGGKSKGVAIIFSGDFIENDEIVFEDVFFKYSDSKGNHKSIPLKLEKIKNKNGGYMLYWEDKDFVIPQKVNPDLPWIKLYEKKWQRAFGVSFVPKGNKRKSLDITVFITPLENYQDGAASWYVWKDHENILSYIQWHNQQEDLLKEYKPCNYLNPEDFDLE